MQPLKMLSALFLAEKQTMVDKMLSKTLIANVFCAMIPASLNASPSNNSVDLKLRLEEVVVQERTRPCLLREGRTGRTSVCARNWGSHRRTPKPSGEGGAPECRLEKEQSVTGQKGRGTGM